MGLFAFRLPVILYDSFRDCLVVNSCQLVAMRYSVIGLRLILFCFLARLLRFGDEQSSLDMSTYLAVLDSFQSDI